MLNDIRLLNILLDTKHSVLKWNTQVSFLQSGFLTKGKLDSCKAYNPWKGRWHIYEQYVHFVFLQHLLLLFLRRMTSWRQHFSNWNREEIKRRCCTASTDIVISVWRLNYLTIWRSAGFTLHSISHNTHPQIEVLLTDFLYYDPEIRLIEKDKGVISNRSRSWSQKLRDTLETNTLFSN